jgi:large conductance mechanosensitive channel
MAEAVKAGAPLIQYGVFINTVVNFVIIALAIFVAVKAMSKLKKAEVPAAPAATPEDILLLRQIRDSLNKK